MRFIPNEGPMTIAPPAQVRCTITQCPFPASGPCISIRVLGYVEQSELHIPRITLLHPVQCVLYHTFLRETAVDTARDFVKRSYPPLCHDPDCVVEIGYIESTYHIIWISDGDQGIAEIGFY